MAEQPGALFAGQRQLAVGTKPGRALQPFHIGEQAGEIGRMVGLNWGGSWARAKDYPHFELAEL